MGRRGGQGSHSALNLSASQSLSSLLTAASLEGRAAKASYFNEEKCINLAWACAQIERRVGEGALSESFFLIKDGIEEDCGLSRSSVRVSSSIPPRSPLRAGSLSLPSVSPHQQSSRGGQVLPPDAGFNAMPLWYSPGAQALNTGERKHMMTP
ncbi:hypothetical protein PBY51_002020 [Eleginops maclovinus]|uniref:Uncharacterized protein n=1 Tax=Eleginops maclovinus TaxID=56733 RepID=A0AAN7WRZ8_ELEMC|nr:hypothetical protein PBY51_002020 [Eleginops maclovinus]